MSSSRRFDDDEMSVLSEKPEVGFLDFEDDRSLYDFNPLEEGGPVTITIPFPFIGGKPHSVLVGETSADKILVRNNTEDPLDIWGISIFSSNPEDSYILSVMRPPTDESDEAAKRDFIGFTRLDDRTLQPGQTFTVWLSCKPQEIGLHTSIVHFDIGDEKIERVAFLLAEDRISQALFSEKPYSRSRGQRKPPVDHSGFVPGTRLPNKHSAGGYNYNLPKYEIPLAIREMIGSGQVPDVLMEELCAKNYTQFFSTLIIWEEIHLEDEMRAYDMEAVEMKNRGHYLSLEVPGLAERRPSLVAGDYIFAKCVSADSSITSKSYQGFIHRVAADEIFLKFDKSVHLRHRNGDRYSVSFTYNRTNMRRLYKAVNSVDKLRDNLRQQLLFPSQAYSQREIRKPSFTPFNLTLNQEQRDSVAMILGCKGAPPYVIHGPPGTGKTVTLVEAILQLYSSNKKTRILVCSSSNSASDHVLVKLLALGGTLIRERDVFRLNASSRSYDDMNPEYMQFCFFDEMVFKCPPLKALMQYRVIISTYMSSATLQAEGLTQGHFSHIFLDEAGQASEPETMVPIASMSDRRTVVVLAGDPRQLGPVVFSRGAENNGLGVSYLERLFQYDCYAQGNANFVTRLVRNYRCHPAILELPSKLFYEGQLLPCKETNSEMESVYNSVGLPNKAFPVLFVGIQGCDEREGNNPSWFNRIEASKVVEIIRKIKKTDCITSADIGVITPYRQQVLKLKKALELLEMEDVKVGSVEQFQGQEREIIIISTVRSTVKHNEIDRVYQLGFLSNHRRFNVAITRARSLLVIVGNPHIISKDRHWDKLLRYCSENGSYQGCLLPEPELHEYTEEEQFSGSTYAAQYEPEQYPDQSQWNVEKEHKPYLAQYQNGGTNPECSKHTWNVNAPSYQPQGKFQTGQCSQQIGPVPEQADNPDWCEHTWNDSDPVEEVQQAKPAEASASEEKVFWSDLSDIKATGWDD
ncbi:P-loop containing nucleoside triphosphate hydrolases superfamily protein [Rhynchospora pubera]|uniref:RNA helicase n=1 Tax=Rhynchospora pubera TaxID=906938 RepID=A0AAV8F820_9POAL|nr:P-loop containing nucleoside triphosphate hydrolases superfamily protein [Rhynchospora pubera]